MKPKPILGQKLYSLNVGNASRGCAQTLTPVTVTRVGRKYFSVKIDLDSCFERAYRLEDWVEETNYSPTTHLYATEQEYLDEKESTVLTDEIRKVFDNWSSPKLSLETLRAINQLITNENCK